MLLAIAMFVAEKIDKIDFSWVEMVGVAVLGWVFLWAKDTLIEGLFLGIFKMKEKE